jgi:hypothetical protein
MTNGHRHTPCAGRRSAPPAAWSALAALLLVCLVLPADVAARPDGLGISPQTLSIRDVELQDSGRAVLLSLEVGGISDEVLRETVESGFPWLVSYELEVYLKRRIVPDARVGAWTIRHEVRYDNLRDEFRVTREMGAGDPSPLGARPAVVVKRIDTARLLAARVNGFPISGAGEDPPATYVLRVRAKVKPVDDRGSSVIARFFKQVPLFPWRGETAWYTREFEH